jgi:hypothetical protein
MKNVTESFFDGLKENAINNALSQARKNRLEKEDIERKERLARDASELEDILSNIPIAKKDM